MSRNLHNIFIATFYNLKTCIFFLLLLFIVSVFFFLILWILNKTAHFFWYYIYNNALCCNKPKKKCKRMFVEFYLVGKMYEAMYLQSPTILHSRPLALLFIYSKIYPNIYTTYFFWGFFLWLHNKKVTTSSEFLENKDLECKSNWSLYK